MSRVIVSGAGSLTGFEVIRALAGADPSLDVWGTDLRADVPAAAYAERILACPPIGAEGYHAFLEELCRPDDVLCYLPILIDEIILLSGLPESPPKVLAPGAEIAALMSSKAAMDAFAKAAGLDTPAILDRDSDARGAVLVKDARFEQERQRRRLPARYPGLDAVPPEVWADPGRIVCEYVDGQETVVHALSNFRGSVTPCVCMRRHEMQGGHDLRAQTVAPPEELWPEVRKMLAALRGHSYGPVDMQFIGTTLIDLDFNFPSALPLFAASGLNSPHLLVRALQEGTMPSVSLTQHTMVRDPMTRQVEIR